LTGELRVREVGNASPRAGRAPARDGLHGRFLPVRAHRKGAGVGAV